MWITIPLLLIGVLCFQAHSLDSPAPAFISLFEPAQAAPELDALFHNREPWIGGDGDYSVELAPGKIAWLFSDTFTGTVRDNKRTGVKFVNNTVAIQQGIGADAKLAFSVGGGADVKPAALFTPGDKRGWFWPQAAILDSEKLCMFLAQVEKTKGSGAFAFKHFAQKLGVIDNPLDAPPAWHMREIVVPFTEMSDTRTLVFGSALLRYSGYVYIFGIDERLPQNARGKQMVLARAPNGQLSDPAAWRFFQDGAWQADFKFSSTLIDNCANEYSVSYLPGARRFVCVYTERGISDKILARSALEPWGPWSEPQTLFKCPEVGWDKRIFCYAAKAHPLLAGDGELIVSYVASSHDFWHTLSDARLYWPRFVRANLLGPAAR